MYIALTQPVIPEYKAVIKLKPVEPEPMKVTNHYKKSDWSWLPYVTFAWVAFLIIGHFFFHA